MKCKNKKIIILDTDILLHYKRADEIDWCEELEAVEVELLITPVVMQEIEKHKVQHQSKKLRKRAGEYAKWINSKIINNSLEAVIRKGTSLRILDTEPLIDFPSNRLDKYIEDDRLIAHAIEWSKNNSDNLATILTADTGMRMKAIGRKLPVILWDDNEYKIPPDPDPLEKRNQELECEIALLKNRIPKLSVEFENGKHYKEFVLKPLTQQEIQAELNREWKTYELGRKKLPIGMASIMTASQYDMNVRKYCDLYEKYLNEISEYENHIVKLDLLLLNSGNAVADDVRIELALLGEFDVQLDYDLPEKPEPPKMPKLGEKFVPGDLLNVNHLKRFLSPMRNIRSSWNIESNQHDHHYLRYCIDTVMHGISVYLPSIYVLFGEISSSTSFEVKYTAFSRDLLEPATGKIIVKVQSRINT